VADRLRAGIVGTGFIAGVHAQAVRVAGAEVVAVLGSSPSATAEGVGRLGAARGARDVEEMVAADDIDVVHVCTPNHTHLPLAVAALAAGKHLVCEKPLATSVADARGLADLAAEGGRVASVPFVYRFYASVREARRRIRGDGANDAVVPLWLLHGTYLQDWLSSAELTNWRVDPALGGASRAFGDIGVHWCDLLEFTTGHRIVRLAARTGRAFSRRAGAGAGADVDVDVDVATEDGAVVVFETDLGAIGSVVISQATPGRKNRVWFSFDGPDTSYSFDQEVPEALWVGTCAQNLVVLRGTAAPGTATDRFSRLPAGHPQGYQDAFNAYVADVYAAVDGAVPDGLPTFADGLRAAVLTQTVLDAAVSERWVEVPS